MNRRFAEPLDGIPPRRDRMPVVAVVALGANLGDRVATIACAVKELARLPLTDEVRVAEPVESVALKPEGPDAEAPAYLNSVALVTTRLAPSILLAQLHAIEERHGRERRERWGDRTLDLDLIAYGDVCSAEASLQLPHPRAATRDFVLVPWLALDADAELPGVGRVDDLVRRLREDS